MNEPPGVWPATLRLTQVREPEQSLRGAERHDPRYGELRDSIRAKGVLLPVLVPPRRRRGRPLRPDRRHAAVHDRPGGRPGDDPRPGPRGQRRRGAGGPDHRQPPPGRDQPGAVRRAAPAPDGADAEADRAPARGQARQEPDLGLQPPRPAPAGPGRPGACSSSGEVPLANAQALANLPAEDQALYAALARDDSRPRSSCRG